MAASVDEALVAFERDSPRALVCDIGLPTEDGFSLLRKIRAIEATRGGHIAAVALSGYGSDEDRERSSAGGFHEHLTKPVALPEFLRTLADMLAKPSSGNSPSGNLPNG
jgi:CheY-like chemotaxis protein